MSIKLNVTNLTIRPSSVIEDQQCSRKWALSHLEKRKRRSNSRANLGTAIHAAAEVIWNEAIKTGNKDLNHTKAIDCAVSKYDDMSKEEEPSYHGPDTPDSIRSLVSSGTKVLIDDIIEITDIPLHAEKRLAVPVVNHPIVKEIAGTIDYISHNTIADIKSSKRTISPQSYVLQQSIYKSLAEANGYTVDYCLIQGVVFTKKPKGTILVLEPNTNQSDYAVKNLLYKIADFYSGVNPDILFPGNTGYYLCSPVWCGFYHDCPFVHGSLK